MPSLRPSLSCSFSVWWSQRTSHPQLSLSEAVETLSHWEGAEDTIALLQERLKGERGGSRTYALLAPEKHPELHATTMSMCAASMSMCATTMSMCACVLIHTLNVTINLKCACSLHAYIRVFINSLMSSCLMPNVFHENTIVWKRDCFEEQL